MKIGIVVSGIDNLAIFKVLSKYDHEYFVFCDLLYGSWGDNTKDLVEFRIQKIIVFMIDKGIDKIVLPPVWEMYFLNNYKEYSNLILPIFSTYLKDYCVKYSLVGKLGFIGDILDIDLLNTYFKKNFFMKFHLWIKDVSMWKYFMAFLSYGDYMVNKVIKMDLRYFKDAFVDTIIPLNYGYFFYSRVITNFLNLKKIRFHGLDKIDKLFQDMCLLNNKKYCIKIFFTGNIDLIKKHKKILRLLYRGKPIDGFEGDIEEVKI